MENKVGDICLLLVQKFLILSGIQSQISELNEGGSFCTGVRQGTARIEGEKSDTTIYRLVAASVVA
jgi:hypothetical protein